MTPNDEVVFRAAIEREHTARLALSMAHASEAPLRYEAREWCASVGTLLALYGHSPANAPLPATLSLTLSGMFEYLAVGKIPEPFMDVVGKGVPPAGPSERRDIEHAVRYRLLCEAGVISDRAPVQRISRAFSVSERAVQGWMKKHPVNIAAWFPLVVNEDRGSLALSLMLRAAERYKSSGRSHAAIASRARGESK